MQTNERIQGMNKTRQLVILSHSKTGFPFLVFTRDPRPETRDPIKRYIAAIFLIFLSGAPACDNHSAAHKKSAPKPFSLEIDHKQLPANDTDRATIIVRGSKPGAPVRWTVKFTDAKGKVLPEDTMHVIEQTNEQLILKTTFTACRASVTAEKNKETRTVIFSVNQDTSDIDGDGFPDAAELNSESDRRSFRAWFTAIAASQFESISDAWPPEKRDCAGLVRFAYTEALKEHTTENLEKYRYLVRSNMPDVRRFNYPDAPLLGELLFRNRAGAFRPSDLKDGAFGAFVTARFLQEANTHFVTRDVNEALPGDLLFFLRFAESDMPYHSMIWLGPEQEGGPARLVYHTGPVNNTAGRIKLITVDELFRHPDPRWHPAPENDNFLGVYRFNILD